MKGRRPNYAWVDLSARARVRRTLREAHAQGTKPRELADRFGVSQKQVSVIVNRKQWGHV